MSPDTSVRGVWSSLAVVASLCTAICCSLLAFHTTTRVTTNPASRLATMDALVHDGTYAIDRSRYSKTIDRIMFDGRKYSSKPPLLATIGAGVYWVLVHGLDMSVRNDSQRDDTVYLLTLILGGGPHLLLLWYGYRILRWFAPDPRSGALAFASLSLGQLGLAYSTTLNNHVPAAACTLAAFYYAYGLRRGFLHRSWCFVYCGFAAGLAIPMDLGSMFFSASIGLYLLSWDYKRTLAWFVPAAVIPVAVNFGLSWWILGSPVPAYLRPELYDYPGSYWRHPKGNDALDEPRPTYLYHMLLGHHGLFSMTPVLAFSIYGMLAVWRKRRRQALEALVIGVPLLVMIVFYAFKTKNYGGNAAGFRWLLPGVPITLLFVAHATSILQRRAVLWLFLLCFSVSQYQVHAAFRDPWQKTKWEQWFTQKPAR